MIRNVTIDLASSDVRAAFVKIQHIVRPADGEHVQDSSIPGTGPDAQANLTLRVAADRLDDVLNQIRELGRVVSERQTGQDVTGQLVDLEARLRNERRIETEILELLETRQDAPLKDVLELRGKLGEIRREIETLTGQREQLARLVSLATVLVIIRAEDAPVERGDTFGAYFGDSFGRAWETGVRFLIDTLATMVRIIIGGLVWWVMLAGVLLLMHRHRRKAGTIVGPNPDRQTTIGRSP